MRKATGNYRTYSILVKLQPRFLSFRWKTCLRQNCSLGFCACSEGSARWQNTLMMMVKVSPLQARRPMSDVDARVHIFVATTVGGGRIASPTLGRLLPPGKSRYSFYRRVSGYEVVQKKFHPSDTRYICMYILRFLGASTSQVIGARNE